MITTDAGLRPQDADRDTDYEDNVDLRDYVKILHKHRWPIVAATALLTALAALMVSGMTPVYRATATLLIETQQTVPVNLDKIIGIDTKNKQYYQTQFEELNPESLPGGWFRRWACTTIRN